MILYSASDNNLPKFNVTTYNINHGDNFNNSKNHSLRTTLKKLIFNSTIPNLIFLQECTQDILDFLLALEEESKDVIVLNSKKIVNGNTKRYEKFEYFIFILYSPASDLKIRNINNSTKFINVMDILDNQEKSILMNDTKDNGFIFRKLLDSKKIIMQNVGLEFVHDNDTRIIEFFNIHLTSKPNLNYLHSYLLNKFLMGINNYNKVILGDFNNTFSSYSINDLKESKQQTMIIRSKTSKLRNINKVVNSITKFNNVTDYVYSNDEHKDYCKRCIDHILYEDVMKLVEYENDMDVEYPDMKPSDHYYIKTTFELKL